MSKNAESKLIEHVNIARNYQRSIRIDIDYGRSDALDGYICHGTATQVLENMILQLKETNQGAFTWTGPFGGGKSSLALTLASAIGRNKAIRTKAASVIHKDKFPLIEEVLPVKKGGWLVIPVVGKRGSVVQEIYRTFSAAKGIEQKSDTRKLTPTSLVEMLVNASQDKTNDGVLLLIDEMGKFLEASASGGDDVYFFQELAEAAARTSGRLVVIGILHQAFKQYASRLGLDSRDDWAKVQGRYVDIPFVAASDEVVELVGQAIQSDASHSETVAIAKSVAEVIRHRRQNIGSDFYKSLDRCWPLHPAMATLLGPISKRQFGQNERSTFGFLSSVEPKGFRAFLNDTKLEKYSYYRPDHYWDFLRANLEPAILASADSHRWAQAVEVVERAEARGTDLHISLIKNIAVIDLFRNGSGLVADAQALCSLHPTVKSNAIEDALADLNRWKMAVFRKHLGSWSVFEGSDFDIDAAISKVRSTLPGLDFANLQKLANLHPIVAKRHYHEKGTLRWMGVTLCHLDSLAKHIESFQPNAGEFGQFVLVFPPGRDSVPRSVLKKVSSIVEAVESGRPPIVVGLPDNFAQIHELGLELVSLEQVRNRPELEGDSVARREVDARLVAISTDLEEAFKVAFVHATWVGQGIEKGDRLKLSVLASNLADSTFSMAPVIMNELVNRDSLSSNSVKARRDLMHLMVKQENKEALGMEGFPAERGLYESILRVTGFHAHNEEGNWQFVLPKSGVTKQFVSLWKIARKMFSKKSGRLPIVDIYKAWASAPYGVRAGMHPILLLLYVLTQKESVAIYKDGVFVPELNDIWIDELLQDAKRFSLGWVEIDEERTTILKGIAKIVGSLKNKTINSDPLEAARALVATVYELPIWTQKTLRLSKVAIDVRDSLLRASDPHKILFLDLANTLGADTSSKYIKALEKPIRELIFAYDLMLEDGKKSLLESVDATSDDLENLRSRAAELKNISGDFRLDALIARLAEFDGSNLAIEGILSLAANKPVRDWNDRDIDSSILTVAEWGLKFRQLETLASVRGRNPSREAFAVVIGAGKEGKTLSRTFDISEKQKPVVKDLAAKILQQLSGKEHKAEVILAALAEAGMSVVESNGAGG